jgi:predicted alpha/beta hydrolase family esterase
MILRGIIMFVCCVLGLIGNPGFAGDVQREADFASDIINTQPSGKVVWLENAGKKFLSLYTDTEKKLSKGAVIILHDQGGHPNQLEMIKGLRSDLPEHNWSTLSLQMPVLEMGAKEDDYYVLFPEAQARIVSAIKYLKENKIETIVLVGYGLGALMAVYAQSEKPEDIAALVTISLAVPQTQQKSAQTLEFIKKIKVPLLDIYAEGDRSAVVESARDRRLAAKENEFYRQDKINDENHLYQHDEGLVVKRIYSWIERVGYTLEADKVPANSGTQSNIQK